MRHAGFAIALLFACSHAPGGPLASDGGGGGGTGDGGARDGAATADALSPLAFREIRVAGKPNQDALLDCLS